MSDKNKQNPNIVPVHMYEGQNYEETIAKTVLHPTTKAAISIKMYCDKQDEVTTEELMKELQRQINKVNDGNMQRAEAILLAQAHTLDFLFAELTKLSHDNMGKHFSAAIKILNMGLKAQSQCRSTLLALSGIKNPKPYIQNNSAKYQQVNNGAAPPKKNNTTTTRARENLKSSNELLEDKTDEQEWLDTGTAETPGKNDKNMEAVGAKHRAKDK